MKAKKVDQLEHKYLEGESTLAEDQEFLSGLQGEAPLKSWANYRRSVQQAVPEDLVENITKQLDKKKTKLRTLFIAASSLAASIVLVLFIFFNPAPKTVMTYEEKAAMLEQVLSMLPEEDKTINEILYEDALLVIYIESK